MLLEELPSHLQSRGQPVDWLDKVVAQNVPELGAAERELAKAKRDATVLKYDAKVVRNGIRKGHPATNLLDPSKVK